MSDFDPHDLEAAISQVDVCFVIDTTGSMMSLIHEARKSARAEADKIAAAGGLDLQFAVVAYRDHPPMDATYVTWVYPFGDGKALDTALAALEASGGGDGPEAVWDGLVEAGNLQWRPTADHLCFLIGDSPPHGYSKHGDQWPDGCPCKLTAGGIIELFDMHHIRLNAISIAGNSETTTAFREVAEGCHGECTEVAHAAAAVTSYGHTMSTTSDMVGATRTYAATISSTPGMTDSMYSSVTGTPMAAVSGMRTYLGHRGIAVPEVGPSEAPKRKKKTDSKSKAPDLK